jgi:hypothetical protein
MSNHSNTATDRTRAYQANDRERRVQSAAEAERYGLSTTWIDPIPVSGREIEIIELYLGEAIDRLLGLTRRPQVRGPP